MSVTETKSDAQAKAEAEVAAWRANRKERLAREAAAKIAAAELRRPKVVTSDGVVIRDANVRLSPADPTAILRGDTEVIVRKPDPAWLAAQRQAYDDAAPFRQRLHEVNAALKLKNPDQPHGIRNPFAIGHYDLALPPESTPPGRDVDPMGAWHNPNEENR